MLIAIFQSTFTSIIEEATVFFKARSLQSQKKKQKEMEAKVVALVSQKIIWFTTNQTLTLQKWMFFQKLSFKSSLLLLVNGQCGIQVVPKIAATTFAFFCLLHYVYYNTSGQQKTHASQSYGTGTVQMVNCGCNCNLQQISPYRRQLGTWFSLWSCDAS